MGADGRWEVSAFAPTRIACSPQSSATVSASRVGDNQSRAARICCTSGENLHMKSLRASVAVLVVGLVVLAGAMPTAADGPPGSKFTRPYYPSIWHGLYGGLHLGWGESGPADGVVGGAQIGYNWQRGQIVYGLEADISAADI